MPMETKNNSKVITLDGLGPLSRPRVFQLYAGLFVGVIILTWTELLVHAKYFYTFGQFAIFLFFGLRAAKTRHRLPEVARVTLRGCLIGLGIAVIAAASWSVIKDEHGWKTYAKIIVFATISASWMFLSFGPVIEAFNDRRSLRRSRTGGTTVEPREPGDWM